MAFESDSLPRRTLGPAVASAIVGVALGVVAVIGVSIVSQGNEAPPEQSTHAEDALLGGPEYGSRH